MKSEYQARLVDQGRPKSEEEEEDLRLKAEEEARLSEEASLKVDKEEQDRLRADEEARLS